MKKDRLWWLFKSKKERPRTGLDWAEKIAAELAALLRVPHAQVELATYHDETGVLVKSFRPKGRGHTMDLVHGNDILNGLDPEYPRTRRFGNSKHSLRRILAALSLEQHLVLPPPNTPHDPRLVTAVDVFVGYLLLDAWIGHTDRHHENWGMLQPRRTNSDAPAIFELAPSYDHAASLGQELLDEKRERILKSGSDALRAYGDRARSGIYLCEGGVYPGHPVDVFCSAARQHPAAAVAWGERMIALATNEVRGVLEAVPAERMSPIAKQFCCSLLDQNRTALASRLKSF